MTTAAMKARREELMAGAAVAPPSSVSPPSSTFGPDKTTITGGAMTVAEFLRWAGIGRTKMYAEVKAGRLKLHKLGTKSLVFRRSAEEWLSSLPVVEAA